VLRSRKSSIDLVLQPLVFVYLRLELSPQSVVFLDPVFHLPRGGFEFFLRLFRLVYSVVDPLILRRRDIVRGCVCSDGLAGTIRLLDKTTSLGAVDLSTVSDGFTCPSGRWIWRLSGSAFWRSCPSWMISPTPKITATTNTIAPGPVRKKRRSLTIFISSFSQRALFE
jgi:hypothetical protein